MMYFPKKCQKCANFHIFFTEKAFLPVRGEVNDTKIILQPILNPKSFKDSKGIVDLGEDELLVHCLIPAFLDSNT